MEKTRRKIYAAKPINIFNTPVATAAHVLILHRFPGSRIEDPGQPHHQAAYEGWMKGAGNTRDVHNAMQYFYTIVLPDLDECIAMPFLDGRLGLGVAGETKKFINWGRPAWFMEPKANPTPEDIETFVRDPQSGLFRIRPFTDEEVRLILAETSDDPQKLNVADAKFVVQHQETRLRTWKVYNRERRPYEEAHLVKMPIPKEFYPKD